MNTVLESLHLSPTEDKHLPGLVSIADDSMKPDSVAEEVLRREAKLLKGGKEDKNIGIDYIFFRRFSDKRSSQVAAYIVINKNGRYTHEQLAQLHHRVWLNGAAPLLYVDWGTRVDILKCAADPLFWNDRKQTADYKPSEVIDTASEIARELSSSQITNFSAFRLCNGSFWDDPSNADWACADKGAHKRLIQAVVDADNALDGAANPIMRRLLLLSVLAKYLEDRGVFPQDWFASFHSTARSFRDVLATGSRKKAMAMISLLRDKFNGDIFDLEKEIEAALNKEVLTQFVDLLDARTVKRQMYLWKQYSFNYIPVEVLSHLYQHFAQSGNGAVFTPPFVADLMLDYAMPYEGIQGDETILDPTCGSGVFLVGAFRRLVHSWQSKNEWKRPSVTVLKGIVRRSVCGAELDKDAAHIAAFNLALAVCDALQPKVIWSELRFDHLIGRNIFVGDFFESLGEIASAFPDGFSVILGNPPFLSQMTSAAEKTRDPAKRSIAIPDRQMAYRVVEECAAMLSSQGRMCLIQTAGVLYNDKAKKFFATFLKTHKLSVILDFTSIRNLFEGADPKTVALVVDGHAPTKEHIIQHLTFRRTRAVHERIGFELDHYDVHYVAQSLAETTPWVWKANLLGGGRWVALGQKAEDTESLKDHCSRMGWDYGEGFISAENGKRDEAEWLTGMPYLPTENLRIDGVVGELSIVTDTEFRSTYSPSRYTGPIMMVRANAELPCAYRENGFVAYRAKIIGISGTQDQTTKIKKFYETFRSNRDILKSLAYLFSTQMMIGKSTALLKRDLDDLPSPTSKFFRDLSWWETLLCKDTVDHFAAFIRQGQNSPLLRNSVTDADFSTYASTFVRLLGSIYSQLRAGNRGHCSGLAYQAFTFGERSHLDWPDDWAEKLKEVVFQEHGAAIQTAKVIRFYAKNTIVIIKPDRMRHWLPSTAIRDADETLVELKEQGF